MTKNQIDFRRLQEDIRHNVAAEKVGMKQAEASMASAGAAYAGVAQRREEAQLKHSEHSSDIELAYYKADNAMLAPWVGILGGG